MKSGPVILIVYLLTCLRHGKALECPVCLRFGDQGSSLRDCQELFPCNSQHDVEVSTAKIYQILSRINAGKKNPRKAPLSAKSVDAKASWLSQLGSFFSKPTCMKLLGTTLKNNKTGHYKPVTMVHVQCAMLPFMAILEYLEAITTTTEAQDRCEDLPSLGTKPARFTVDQMCICPDKTSQEMCSVSNEDLTGFTGYNIRIMDKINQIMDLLVPGNRQSKSNRTDSRRPPSHWITITFALVLVSLLFLL